MVEVDTSAFSHGTMESRGSTEESKRLSVGLDDLVVVATQVRKGWVESKEGHAPPASEHASSA